MGAGVGRRSFLKALACVPAAPVLLRGMSWAAPTQEELVTEQKPATYSCEVPPGTILPWVGDDAPPGFLPCDGRAVPQVAFQRLHSAIGDAFGVVPARRFRWRRFRVPDLRASARPAAAVAIDQREAEFRGVPFIPIKYVIRT